MGAFRLRSYSSFVLIVKPYEISRVGQGLWFMRRGEYVIEVRVTFETTLADDVFDFVATVAEGLPAARKSG